MNIIVTGATGTVGSEVIRQAILDNEVAKVFALTRRPLEIKDGKLREIIHPDFLDYSSLRSVFSEVNAIVWCLGISQLQVSKEEYSVITHDYALAAAKAALVANPAIDFIFVSGEGADPSGKSRTLFARVKGKTENNLRQIGFKRLIIARRGAIKPIHKHNRMPFAYKLMLPLFPLIELFAPGAVISSVQLAKALLWIAKNGSDKQLLENPDLKRIGSATGRETSLINEDILKQFGANMVFFTHLMIMRMRGF